MRFCELEPFFLRALSSNPLLRRPPVPCTHLKGGWLPGLAPWQVGAALRLQHPGIWATVTGRATGGDLEPAGRGWPLAPGDLPGRLSQSHRATTVIVGRGIQPRDSREGPGGVWGQTQAGWPASLLPTQASGPPVKELGVSTPDPLLLRLTS